MSKSEKKIHIPTKFLLLIFIACGIWIFIDAYVLFFVIGKSQNIYVNGIEYIKGTEEYASAIFKMRLGFGFLGLIALVVTIIAGIVTLKRIMGVNETTQGVKTDSAQKLNLIVHIPIIIVLLVLQFFSQNIFSSIYLPNIEKKYNISNEVWQFFKSGEYTSAFEEAPDEFLYVVVTQYGNTKEEVFYLKDGTRQEVAYKGDQWIKDRTTYNGNYAFLLIPLIGFFFFFIAILRKMNRTKTYFTTAFQESDKFEKLSFLYGFTLFASSIFFLVLKNMIQILLTKT